MFKPTNMTVIFCLVLLETLPASDVSQSGSSKPIITKEKEYVASQTIPTTKPSTTNATSTEEPSTTITTAPEEPSTTITTAPEEPSTTITTAPEEPSTTITTAPEEPSTTITTAPEEPSTTITTAPEEPSTTITTAPEEPSTTITTAPEEPSTTITTAPEEPSTTITTAPEEPSTTITTAPEDLQTTISSYVVPACTNITNVEKFENSLELTVNRSEYFNMLRITINSTDTGEYYEHMLDIKEEQTVVVVGNLTTGTRYWIKVSTIINANGQKLESKGKAEISTFTLPGMPGKVDFPLHDIHEGSFTVNITEGPENGDHHGYSLHLTDQEVTNCTNTSVVTFSNLEPGFLYNMTIYSKWLGVNGTTPLNASIHTRPTPPESVVFTNIEGENITLNVTDNRSWDFYSFIFYNGTQNINITVAKEKLPTVIPGLEYGTLYTINVHSIVAGLSSESSTHVSSYTRPSIAYINNVIKFPTKLQVNIDRSSFFNALQVNVSSNDTHNIRTVTYSLDNDTTNFIISNLTQETVTDRFDNDTANSIISNPTQETVTGRFDNDTANFTISNLTQGTHYKFTIVTLIATEKWLLQSRGWTENSTFTLPGMPSLVDFPLHDIHESSFTVNITQGPKNGSHDGYCIHLTNISNLDVSNCTNTSDVTFSKLEPGSLYNLTIYSKWLGVNGTTPLNASIHTRPTPPESVVFTNLEGKNITLNVTDNKRWDFYRFSFYNGTQNINITVAEDKLPIVIPGLEYGTFYTINVHSIIAGLSSERSTNVSSYTRPSIAYINNVIKFPTKLQVNIDRSSFFNALQVNVSSNETNNIRTVTYSLDNDTTNFIISNLTQETVTDRFDNDTTNFIISNPTQETVTDRFDNDTANFTISNLTQGTHHKFTIVTLIATEKWLLQSRRWTEYSTFTLPGMPKKVDFPLHDIHEDSFTVNISQGPENGSHDGYCIHLTDQKVTHCTNTSDVTFSNLEPGFLYNLTIYSKWLGVNGTTPLNASIHTQPGTVDGIKGVDNGTTNSALKIQWTPPIGHHDLFRYNATCKGPNANSTSRYIHDNTTGTTAVLSHLDPGTHCSVIISVVIINTWEPIELVGKPVTEAIDITSRETAPGKVGISLDKDTVTANSFVANWNIPDVRNGIIRQYDAIVTTEEGECEQLRIFICNDSVCNYNHETNDIQEGNHLHCSQTEPVEVFANGKESFSWTVTQLHAFRNYTITVVPYTVTKGASSSTSIRTCEDRPGPISEITLAPENNVTKVRSITITWKPPTKRNLNGVILRYHVELHCENSCNLNEPCNYTTDDNKTTLHVFTKISTGYYTVKVYAETKIGPGNVSSANTEVIAGAPLPIPETSNHPVMQKALKSASDKKKEIVVELPTESFLCNNTNGALLEWGLVVAEAKEATDASFNGDKAEFDKKKRSLYKVWSQIKDEDSIQPYIATPIEWNPCRSREGTRRRRSTNQYPIFTVGEMGECSGQCNGELKPGRTYRVKSFACTSSGCTETLYSLPIATDPDPTVPIVTGLLSALIVIGIAIGVTFVLRRRRAACFAKGVDDVDTRTAGKDIALNRMESKKKKDNSPGAIKLRDFPDRVDQMHRDSGLLFAASYKIIKEKSPQFPKTEAVQQCCRPKNRYTNILPFDHSRVKLRPSDDVEGSDYINANYIPGYNSRREYIATQGPLPATFEDFWRMVWEQNVDTIVMLTKLIENGRIKCDKYWPDLNEHKFYGDLAVTLLSESNLSAYTIRIFEMKWKGESKMVRQFSYLKWPDMGCPETPQLLLDFVKGVRQHSDRNQTHRGVGPTIVHCSAGVGRTGTFIAVDHLLQHIRDHDEVDIDNVILDMRNQRLNMVQTEEQYVYIHDCLKAFIMADEVEEEDSDEEPVYMNLGHDEDNPYENTAFVRE